MRSEKKVEASHEIICKIQAGDQVELINTMNKAITTLARLDPDQFKVAEVLEDIPVDSIPLVIGSIEAFLPLSGMVDQEAEMARISRELEYVEEQIERLQALLAGPFSSRAPNEVVENERNKLEALQETAEKLVSQREMLTEKG
jgi:valyl-tRNA synthetase